MAYLVFLKIFSFLAVLSGAFILLSAIWGILFINPFDLLFIFLGSIGLALTSWRGLSSKEEREKGKIKIPV